MIDVLVRLRLPHIIVQTLAAGRLHASEEVSLKAAYPGSRQNNPPAAEDAGQDRSSFGVNFNKRDS
jgi:hypothetical protein